MSIILSSSLNSGGDLPKDLISLDSVEDMQSLGVSALQDGQSFFVYGRYFDGDGGGGFFQHKESSTKPEDGGTVFAPNIGAGRLERYRALGDKTFDARWWGFGSPGNSASENDARHAQMVSAIKAEVISSGIGQATVDYTQIDSDKFILISQPMLWEAITQIKLMFTQGCHIRNATTDEHVLHLKGGGAVSPQYGFVVEDLVATSLVEGTKSAVKLENTINSWLNRVYVDTSCKHGIEIDPTSTENTLFACHVEETQNLGNGIYVRGNNNRITNCLTLGCTGSGLEIASGVQGTIVLGHKSNNNDLHGVSDSGIETKIIGCDSWNNSKSPSDTYSGFACAGTRSQYIGLTGYDTQGAPTQKYGARFAGSANKAFSINGTGNVTSLAADAGTGNQIYSVDGISQPGFVHNTPIIHKNPPVFVDGDTTPDVSAANFFQTNNSGATSITTFDGGTNGQEVKIVCLDSNTTFVNSASMQLGGANLTPAANDYLTFVNIGGTWYGGQVTA